MNSRYWLLLLLMGKTHFVVPMDSSRTGLVVGAAVFVIVGLWARYYVGHQADDCGTHRMVKK